MDPSISPYVAQDPVLNVDQVTALKVKQFGDQLGLTGRLVAIKIDQDITGTLWTEMVDIASALTPADRIRYALVYDRYPNDACDVGYQWKNLTNKSQGQDQRLRQFTADVCNQISNNNPNAGADQAALLDSLLTNAAMPTLNSIFSTIGVQ